MANKAIIYNTLFNYYRIFLKCLSGNPPFSLISMGGNATIWLPVKSYDLKIYKDRTRRQIQPRKISLVPNQVLRNALV